MKHVEYHAEPQHSHLQARRHDRVPVDFSVTLRWPGLRMTDRAKDLSEGGLCVNTTDPLEPMTLVSLRLEVPHSDLPIDMLGRVMWASKDTMGIRFESVDRRIFDSIERLRQDFQRI